MLLDIHATMQDTDNFNSIFPFKAVKDQMLTNTKLKITFPNIIAYAPDLRIMRKIMKSKAASS